MKAKAKAPVKKAPARPIDEVKPITPEEQAIAARVGAEADDWKTITEDSALDYDLGRDVFELPPPAKAKQNKKEFAFRWILRDPKRLDEMRSKPAPFKWWICNSTNTPFLSGFFDPVLGCVCREDQMLMFKPWWMRDKEWAHKRGLADSLDKSGELTGKNGQFNDGIGWEAGKRSIDRPELGLEVRGGDVVMADEGMMDERAGIRHSEASDNDLIVDE